MAAAVPAWEVDDLTDYRALVRARLAHVVPVAEPLVLISQIQRSGGTLLLQLLDGHRECHVDPYELKIGHPKKHNWPPLDLDRPERWFETLYFRGTVERIRRTDRTRRPDSGRSVFPYLFSPRLQKRVFDERAAGASSEREILDAYFTSYFNAWLDNHNLYTGPKRAVVGFTPRLAMENGNLERYLAAYADGTLISIVRDPRAWYESAAKHGYLEPRYRDSPKLRARAEQAAPTRLGRVPSPLLRAVERSLPPPDGVLRYLRKEAPDLMLVTPLVDLGSRQADWLRGAKRLGIRTCYPVFSWDNLTNKGLVRDEPDLTLVWNDLQAREAEELHGISAARIRITGAPVGDPWFDRGPGRSREEFCAEVGLDPLRRSSSTSAPPSSSRRTRSSSSRAGSSGCARAGASSARRAT
jgi:hypothetical protein